MITLGIIFVIVVVIIAMAIYGHRLEQIPYKQEEANFFTKGYKEDIDFSLMIKGYPVVNDIDIRYTEWLVKNPSMS